jgi:hypothetical protein
VLKQSCWFICDRDAISPSGDPLNGIGSPMNKSKTKRKNQALQGLIVKINEKEIQHACIRGCTKLGHFLTIGSRCFEANLKTYGVAQIHMTRNFSGLVSAK